MKLKNSELEIDFGKPIDISIALYPNGTNVNCFYAPEPEAWPVRSGNFVGSTAEGGPLNFKNIKFNPHGNGTHTECVGHISKEPYTINSTLRKFHFRALLISLTPRKLINGDLVIDENLVKEQLMNLDRHEALIIRTLPNSSDKKSRNYSGSNPPYFSSGGMEFIVENGIQHLLVDLPSVDRESDDGALRAHKAFWKYPGAFPRLDATITELIYVPNKVPDGSYLLNLQICSLELDASPSKPVLYSLSRLSNN